MLLASESILPFCRSWTLSDFFPLNSRRITSDKTSQGSMSYTGGLWHSRYLSCEESTPHTCPKSDPQAVNLMSSIIRSLHILTIIGIMPSLIHWDSSAFVHNDTWNHKRRPGYEMLEPRAEIILKPRHDWRSRLLRSFLCYTTQHTDVIDWLHIFNADSIIKSNFHNPNLICQQKGSLVASERGPCLLSP